MKKYLYMAVAAIAAFSSCSSDDIVNGNGNDNGNAKAPVFTATIEGEATSRTALVEGSTAGKLTKVAWVSEDKVNINGSAYTAAPGTEDATTATLTIADGETAPEAVDGKYYAVYPSTITFDASTQTLTLPATQTYDATTNGIGNVPMVAVSENTELQFKNICTVLAIKVAEGTVKAIKVMADGKALSGDFTLDTETSSITATSGENYVVLECGTAVTADNTTFYVAIPPQEYSSLQIYLSEDGSTYKEAMATKKAAGLGTLERNKIFPITYAKNAVQLWADGPYFATTNVGGTQKYQWGATAAGDEGTANSGDYDLEHDTAYKLWGSAWRMPTNDEYVALVSNCTMNFDETGVKFDVSSKTSGYGPISFPATTEASSYTAQYWTSTENSSGWSTKHICILGFMKGGSFSVMNNSTYEYSSPCYVRPVLATPAAAPAVTPTPTPTSNLLAGEFSVSATKKVQFTKGNLWCDASTSPATFGFEANQYDFPTSYNYPDDASTKLWTCTHVGHFFWNSYADYTLTDDDAKPGKPHEFKPYFSAYGPKSKSASDEFWCGEDHKLEVAGTQGLYTLSADEWAYLLNPPYYEYTVGRTQTNRFARARVKDTYGYLIFPDGYNEETAVSGTGIGTVNEDGNSGYPSANIPDATWADMEAAGVVFLPNAGIRKGTVYYSGYGKYWSSTPNAVSKAKNTYFDANGIVDCPGNEGREVGSSIRLVKTVE